jgi:uncharacterized protein YndB with AHSA1/START domain
MAQAKSNKIKIHRLYKAPVKAVWQAWTDPEQVAQWWGPRGFTITHHHKDLREGGTWKYTMHGPDGVDYPNLTKYFEVKEEKSLVYDHGGTESTPPLFRVNVTFNEIKGQTQMDMTMTFPTAEIAAQTKTFIRQVGGDATWDRLGEFLFKKINDKNKFVINRSFDIKTSKMFELWTDPKLFSQWLPPTGFRMEFIKADIRPGGKNFYMMTDDKNVPMYGSVHYLEINPIHELIYTQQFNEANGNVSRHPMAPTWPETMHTTVQLTEEEGGQTRITVEWEPYGKVSKEELDTFLSARAGMTLGWTGSFNKLEEYLSKK